MDFILKYQLNSRLKIKIEYCENLSSINIATNTFYIKKLLHLDYIEHKNHNRTQLAMGDVIKVREGENDLSKCKGLFYLLALSSGNKSVVIRSDVHSLLPLYYYLNNDFIFISTSFMALIPHLATKTTNENFYTELALLYTQLNGSTYFNEIKKLEYGEVIELNGSFEIRREKRFYNYFTDSPKSFKSSINDVANEFIENSKFYLRAPCAISLTGGFDGRTIIGCAHYHKTDFISFSYGKKGSGDVENPFFLAKELNLNYKLVELDQNYTDTIFDELVTKYIEYSGGLNGFQFPQTLYTSMEIAKEKNIILNGYFGSELLANVKGEDDEIHPIAIIDFLQNNNLDRNLIYNKKELLKRLNLINKDEDIENCLTELKKYFDSLPKDLTKNQKYAVLGFENIYRYLFGTWIYNAMHYTKVRIPFIDYDFFKNIAATEVSQFYRSFMEKNPFKRIQGQMLYPLILKRTWKELNLLNSSKGYTPHEIETYYGRYQIMMKKMLKINQFYEKNGLDKMSILSGMKLYINNTSRIEKNEKAFLLDIMQSTPVNRMLCSLSLTKVEANSIFK